MIYHTRIAPSPTGMFHMGTARTAIFNWLMARATGGSFTLRIDDTDASRNDASAVKVIYDAMDWLGLDYDNTFRQSDRGVAYSRVISRLVDSGRARLVEADKRDPVTGDIVGRSVVTKLNVPDALPDVWADVIKGDIRITDKDRDIIGDLVLARSDGSPTYHFASVADDIASDVNLVMRGVDHTANTAKQVAIWRAISDAPMPEFAHLGLIEVIDPDSGKRKKLSKRDAGASLLDYRDAGVHPDAMFNYLLRLGWSPSDPNFDKHTPLITRDMALEMFIGGGKMKNSPVLFDPTKLNWYDRKYKAK